MECERESEKKKKVKLTDEDQDSLKGQKGQAVIIIIMVKGYTKQGMHKAIAHHPLTDAQPVSKQQSYSLANSLKFIY